MRPFPHVLAEPTRHTCAAPNLSIHLWRRRQTLGRKVRNHFTGAFGRGPQTGGALGEATGSWEVRRGQEEFTSQESGEAWQTEHINKTLNFCAFIVCLYKMRDGAAQMAFLRGLGSKAAPRTWQHPTPSRSGFPAGGGRESVGGGSFLLWLLLGAWVWISSFHGPGLGKSP